MLPLHVCTAARLRLGSGRTPLPFTYLIPRVVTVATAVVAAAVCIGTWLPVAINRAYLAHRHRLYHHWATYSRTSILLHDVAWAFGRRIVSRFPAPYNHHARDVLAAYLRGHARRYTHPHTTALAVFTLTVYQRSRFIHHLPLTYGYHLPAVVPHSRCDAAFLRIWMVRTVRTALTTFLPPHYAPDSYAQHTTVRGIAGQPDSLTPSAAGRKAALFASASAKF